MRFAKLTAKSSIGFLETFRDIRSAVVSSLDMSEPHLDLGYDPQARNTNRAPLVVVLVSFTEDMDP